MFLKWVNVLGEIIDLQSTLPFDFPFPISSLCSVFGLHVVHHRLCNHLFILHLFSKTGKSSLTLQFGHYPDQTIPDYLREKCRSLWILSNCFMTFYAIIHMYKYVMLLLNWLITLYVVSHKTWGFGLHMHYRIDTHSYLMNTLSYCYMFYDKRTYVPPHFPNIICVIISSSHLST